MPTENEAMQMILHGGNARAKAYEALQMAKQKKFKEAETLMQAAEEELGLAHESQTKLLQEGADTSATMLVAHAMDHLMTAMSEKGLIAELIELHRLK